MFALMLLTISQGISYLPTFSGVLDDDEVSGRVFPQQPSPFSLPVMGLVSEQTKLSASKNQVVSVLIITPVLHRRIPIWSGLDTLDTIQVLICLHNQGGTGVPMTGEVFQFLFVKNWYFPIGRISTWMEGLGTNMHLFLGLQVKDIGGRPHITLGCLWAEQHSLLLQVSSVRNTQLLCETFPPLPWLVHRLVKTFFLAHFSVLDSLN